MKEGLFKTLFFGFFLIEILNANIIDSSERSKNVYDYQTINRCWNYSIAGSIIHFSSYPIYLGGVIWMAKNNEPKYMPLAASIAGIAYTVGPLISCFSEKKAFNNYKSDQLIMGESGFHYYGHSWIFLGTSAACFSLAALNANN